MAAQSEEVYKAWHHNLYELENQKASLKEQQSLQDHITWWVINSFLDSATSLGSDTAHHDWFNFYTASTDVSGAKKEIETYSYDTQPYDNKTSLQQSDAIKRSVRIKDSFSFGFTEGVKLGAQTTTEIKLPFVGKEKVTFSAELNFQANQHWTKELEKSWEINNPIQIPPYKRVEATFLIEQVHFDGTLTIQYAPAFTEKGQNAWNAHIDKYVSEFGDHEFHYKSKVYGKFKDILPPLRDRPLLDLLNNEPLAYLQTKASLKGIYGLKVTIILEEKDIPVRQ